MFESDSSMPRATFQAERRITRVDAYVFGGLGLFIFVGGILVTINFGGLHLFQLMVYGPALLVFGVAINFYRRRGEVTFRVVGDEKRFVMKRKHEDVTIRFQELTKVVYDDRTEGSVVTTFHLSSGCIEHLGVELVDHGPLLAYVRRRFAGEMRYNGKTITSPKEIPQRPATPRTKLASRRRRRRAKQSKVGE